MVKVYITTAKSGRDAAVLAQEQAFSESGIPVNAEISKTVLGKPYLRSYPGIQFNISHSGPYGVCAIANSTVGVDVEMIRPLKKNIAARFFTESEKIYLDRNPEEEFFRLWTRKEAFVKAIGKGLTIQLNSFSVLNDRLYQNGMEWKFYTYHIENGFLSVCTQEDHVEITG